RPARHDHRACVGYISKAPDGSVELLFSNDKLRKICGSAKALFRLKQELRSGRMLLEDEHGPSVKRTIWKNGGREQVIAIRARAFSRQSAAARAGASIVVQDDVS